VDAETQPPLLIPRQFKFRLPVPAIVKLFVSCVTTVPPVVITTLLPFKFMLAEPVLNVVGKFPVLDVIPDELQMTSE
jgi:hypothetical protein